MPRPGVTVTNRDAPPARGAITDTGQWFVAGITEKGPTNVSTKIESLSQYVATYGQRVTYGSLYDALDVFFREGGSRVHVVRVVGPAAAVASLALSDGTATTLTVQARNVGEWGNDLRIAVIAGDAGGEFKLVVTNSAGTELERSPSLVDKAAALAWYPAATYINLVSGAGTGDPSVIAATPLVGGADDRASITDTHWNTALGLFVRSLGPGQVSMPGRTTATAHGNLMSHAANNNRVALLDAPDTAVVATMTAAATSAKALGNTDYGAMFAPWVKVPGVVSGTTRTVPYSAVQAGLEARRDATLSPNRAAAGRDFGLQYVTSLNTEFSDADRETLLLAGVNTAKTVFGLMETYGYRSLANPTSAPTYLQFNYARLRMAITARGEDIGEGFVFAQIDGRGLKTAEFGNAIAGMLLDYYVQGSLYGETPDEAFRVDTGPTVNTPVTIAAGELRAVASVRMSPHAEVVYIEFVKTPITQAV